jgi:hypothetical protein
MQTRTLQIHADQIHVDRLGQQASLKFEFGSNPHAPQNDAFILNSMHILDNMVRRFNRSGPQIQLRLTG